MKNVKNILMFVLLSTFVFASGTRTDALGGAGFWADDYANINAFPASVNDHNVAWTDGSNFTSIFDKDGTTWGFAGGTGNDVVDMYWGNGTYGVNFNLAMTPEMKVADGDAMDADAETDFGIGFGMPLAGGDFGFTYASTGTLGINHRRAQDVWLWDNMLVNVGMTPEDFADGNDQVGNTALSVNCYTNKSYDGGTSGLFALGFNYEDMGPATDGGDDPDATMGIEWNFAVESEMTDWATLRLGYSHAYDFANGGDDDGGLVVGLGFNYGSFNLDMNLNTVDADDNGSNLFTDPVRYLNGRNTEPLGAEWTISYNW